MAWSRDWKDSMTFVHKIINAAARFPYNPSDKRYLVDTILQQLPGVTYQRLREFGFVPGGIVDVDACDGEWSRIIRQVFGRAPILMIEARDEQRQSLTGALADIPDSQYLISLLGRESAPSIPFYVCESGSSLFIERSNAMKAERTIPMATLDDTMENFKELSAPLFLKLDIQGAELECLRGAISTLQRTEVVQLEAALLNYNEGAPHAAEVIAFMSEHGFALFDVAGFVRQNGGNLVQLDLVFVGKNSKLRKDTFKFGQAAE